jgi:hypothetical protein
MTIQILQFNRDRHVEGKVVRQRTMATEKESPVFTTLELLSSTKDLRDTLAARGECLSLTSS